jgi:hypothetical protein
LEPGWNGWNRFLNEYGKVLLEYGANFTYVNEDITDLFSFLEDRDEIVIKNEKN